MKILGTITMVLAIVFGGVLFLQHEADRNAALRQQVQQAQQCASPPPAGDVNPITSCPPGSRAPQPNPGPPVTARFVLDCSKVQCVSPGLAGAGPDGTTCQFEHINGATAV